MEKTNFHKMEIATHTLKRDLLEKFVPEFSLRITQFYSLNGNVLLIHLEFCVKICDVVMYILASHMCMRNTLGN